MQRQLSSPTPQTKPISQTEVQLQQLLQPPPPMQRQPSNALSRAASKQSVGSPKLTGHASASQPDFSRFWRASSNNQSQGERGERSSAQHNRRTNLTTSAASTDLLPVQRSAASCTAATSRATVLNTLPSQHYTPFAARPVGTNAPTSRSRQLPTLGLLQTYAGTDLVGRATGSQTVTPTRSGNRASFSISGAMVDRIRAAYASQRGRASMAVEDVNGIHMLGESEDDHDEEQEQDVQEIATAPAPTWAATLRLLWPLQPDYGEDAVDECEALMHEIERRYTPSNASKRGGKRGVWAWLTGLRGRLGRSRRAVPLRQSNGSSLPLEALEEEEEEEERGSAGDLVPPIRPAAPPRASRLPTPTEADHHSNYWLSDVTEPGALNADMRSHLAGDSLTNKSQQLPHSQQQQMEEGRGLWCRANTMESLRQSSVTAALSPHFAGRGQPSATYPAFSPSVAHSQRPAAAVPGEGQRQLIFRGLRVRMGIHAGVYSPSEVHTSETAGGRVRYSGLPLKIATAVSTAACGGGVLLSQAALNRYLAAQEDEGQEPGRSRPSAADGLKGMLGVAKVPERKRSAQSAGDSATSGAAGRGGGGFSEATAKKVVIAYSGDHLLEDLEGVHGGAHALLPGSTLQAPGWSAARRRRGSALGPASLSTHNRRRSIEGPASGVNRRRSIEMSAAVTDAGTGGPVPLTVWPLYSLVPERAFARMAYLAPPVSRRALRLGVADAPVAAPAFCFLYVAGAQALLAEQAVGARKALDALQLLVCAEAWPRGGFVVEAADAYTLAAFPRASDALAWGLACRAALLAYTGWDVALMRHPLASTQLAAPTPVIPAATPELVSASEGGAPPAAPTAASLGLSMKPQSAPTAATAVIPHASRFSQDMAALSAIPRSRRQSIEMCAFAAARMSLDSNQGEARLDRQSAGGSAHGAPPPGARQVLARGPRIKVGVDCGEVTAELHPYTGRLNYRGAVLNRAARVANKAGEMQVLATGRAWARAQAEEAQAAALQGQPPASGGGATADPGAGGTMAAALGEPAHTGLAHTTSGLAHMTSGLAAGLASAGPANASVRGSQQQQKLLELQLQGISVHQPKLAATCTGSHPLKGIPEPLELWEVKDELEQPVWVVPHATVSQTTANLFSSQPGSAAVVLGESALARLP